MDEKCLTCGFYPDPPNVRVAKREDEAQALEERYRASLERASNDGSLAGLQCFESRMHSTSAVINVDLDFLYPFLTNSQALYSTYSLGVRGQVRKPANPDDDRERRTIESKLFGSYGEQIRYAALSADGAGVASYGAYTLRLSDVAVRDRASLLEENSYDFVDRHDLLRRGVKIPLGYRSTWDERYKLAVAKLGESITPATTEDEFAGILLFSEGDRSTDRFIEVHIYGPFDAGAIESVRGQSDVKDRGRKADIQSIKDVLATAGQDWVEG